MKPRERCVGFKKAYERQVTEVTQRGSWRPEKSENYVEYLANAKCLTRLPHLHKKKKKN